MTETTVKKSKRKALLTILICAAIIFILILARGNFSPGIEYDLNTADGREAYLNSLGWEINKESESFKTVIVPDKLDGIMAQYNRMQQAQGYDLSLHLGESCSQYSYELTNYTDSDGTVIVTLYIQDGALIAADIHTTAVNGFMHGLKKNEKQ
ncbi:MAG: DUF4830 domain-containing protein [Oscillospiraceae bacterium]|nr:DUF4830 domain-containing protein [Oscillospiraceae bacterium]